MALNKIKSSSDEVRASYGVRQLEEDYPYEVERYEVAKSNYEVDCASLDERYRVAKRNYELQLEHDDEILKLCRTDYEGHVQRIIDSGIAKEPPGCVFSRETGLPLEALG